MKLYQKIDLFFAGQYLCTTQQYKTCKGFRKSYLESLELRSRSLGGIGLVDAQILKHPKLLKASKQKEG